MNSPLTYAVEAGSAGEAVAQENQFKYNSVASQADALMEVASGTSDAAIIDLLMAGAMIFRTICNFILYFELSFQKENSHSPILYRE